MSSGQGAQVGVRGLTVALHPVGQDGRADVVSYALESEVRVFVFQ